MRLIKVGLLVFLSFFLCIKLTGQSILTGINDSVINLPCSQLCANLSFKIPHLKSNEDYSVVSIPYSPYPYTTATGNELTDLYDDDVFGAAIPLPFPICFYGAVYNNVVVGSNGLLTFDVSNASCANSYTVNPAIPYAGGTQCDQFAIYYPRASIMGAYSDLDASSGASPSDRKIEWRFEGTAPFRRFIASWYHVGVFGNTGCSANTPTTFQIVVNEATAVIEVFFEQKNCNDFSTGKAILGVQNWNKDQAIAAPGKNATVWTAVKEGYRFIPSGAVSRFVSSQLLTLAGVPIETATTSTTTSGLLDISFPTPVCPATLSEQYIVRTIYSSCVDPTNQIVINDTITINKSTLNATATSTQTDCGPGNGTITVNIPPGSGSSGPYTFVLNPGNISQTVPGTIATFNNLLAGNYTITVTDITGICSSTVPATVTSTGILNVTYTVTAPSCAGASNGSITVDPPMVTDPVQYTINGSSNPNNVFSNLPAGLYSININAGPGCSRTISVTIPPSTNILTGTASGIPTSCAGVNNGSITATATNGSGPYTFSIDNGTSWQASNVFNGLAPGNYTVVIREGGVCTSAGIAVTITSGAGVTANVTPANTSCTGGTNGSITVTPTNGTGPYTFVLNGTTTQTGATNTVFTNLAANTYSIVITDAAGCISSSPISVTINDGPAITVTPSKTDALCFGTATGNITNTVSAIATAPIQYSLNNVIWQASPNFNSLVANTYTVYVRDAVGCSNTATVTIDQPAQLTATASVQNVLCNGQSNGLITINATGGTMTYSYSLDNITFQPANTFNVVTGTYTVYIRDANNCAVQVNNVNVTQPAALTAIATSGNATCDGGNDGPITVTPTGGTSPYRYSSDGITFQASNILKAAPGNYDVVVKDANECVFLIPGVDVGLTNNLTLTPATDPPPICEGNKMQLQLNTNATQFAWTPLTGLSNASIINPLASPATTTAYTVVATLGRCTITDDILVTILTAPIPDAGQPGDICYGQTFQLQGSGGVTYIWTPSDFLSSTTINNPVASPDKTIIYTLNVIDANGCSSLVPDDVVVKVTPPIKVTTFPSDTVVLAGSKFQLLATSVGTDYTWSPATGLDNPNIPNPGVTAPAIDGSEVVYQVSVTTSAGCQGEGNVRLRVYKGPDIYVPTAFTPNNDGKNETFIPFPVGIKQLNYFRVYNRWGQMLYSSSALNQGWDGKFGGIEQVSGVYVWMAEGVTTDDRIITKKGTVALIR
jgi:gliding motility-associated-like protein